jgi:hypothetical protein
MTNRNAIGISVIIIMLIIDLLIYQYQKANSSKGMIPCYIPNKENPQKDIADTIK